MLARNWRSILLGDEPTEATGTDLDYLSRPRELRHHNRIAILRSGGESFPAMLAAIEGAKRYIHLSSYIVRADTVGTQFQRALIARAKSGVLIRFSFDSLGSFGLPEKYVAELRDAGIEVVESFPLAPWRPRSAFSRRNHQKILIVDGAVGFTGGLNIGDEYAPEPEGGGWHDMHAMVEGPIVYDLERAYRRSWRRVAGTSIHGLDSSAPHQVGAAFRHSGYSVDNVGLRSRFRMHHDYLHAIRRAKHTISIMNAYFIPDRGLRRQFRRAVERGVSVRVIVPSVSDVAVVYHASRHLYGRLLRHGVRIFEWPERMMHAKVGAIDSTWGTIGSYNLDARSFLHNFEVGLVLLDRELASTLQSNFDSDVAKCREFTIHDWQRRSARERFLQWFTYGFRYWL
ncbi:MAG: cardiolipin synthase ClsB [Planctomycetes bacterium]|nr:cardiolipin synthase ClsB [Planctomycetota bacterium]